MHKHFVEIVLKNGEVDIHEIDYELDKDELLDVLEQKVDDDWLYFETVNGHVSYRMSEVTKIKYVAEQEV